MRFLAQVKKESMVSMKNWQAYFLALIIPVLAVLLNMIMTTTSRSTLEIGVVPADEHIISILKEEFAKIENEKLLFKINGYDSYDQAEKQFQKKNISMILSVRQSRYLTLWYDGKRQDSQIAVQYVSNVVQSYISQGLVSTYPEKVMQLKKLQLYEIEKAADTGTGPEGADINMMILFGIMWILLFTPINSSISQIQEEKRSGTMFYLYKLRISKFHILLAKQIGILVQSLLSLAILLLLVFVLTKQAVPVTLPNIALIVLIVFCMSSIGYFIGFLTNEVSVSTLLVLLNTIPTMLVTSLNTETSIDGLIRIMPSYYTSRIIYGMLANEPYSIRNIVICLVITIIFYGGAITVFTRKDAVQLCRTL